MFSLNSTVAAHRSVAFTVDHAAPNGYRGRFAPSPTGVLHAGSLLAAVASYLDARANGGQWLVRMEDLDGPRCIPGAAERILQQLDSWGMHWDGEVVYQSQRTALYQDALSILQDGGHVYPCSCTRKEIASVAHAGVDGPVYPGTCRNGLKPGAKARAWRVRVPQSGVISFTDRIQGAQLQALAEEVGDFVLQRADGLFAYQLAVVVDDALQGITHIVRGADLLDSTPRQQYLQQLLNCPSPEYAHIPVLVNYKGEKLSKQTLAPEVLSENPVPVLWNALLLLGQNPDPALLSACLQDFWSSAVNKWDLRSVPVGRRVQSDGRLYE
ncbi:tRNA glutamyl-Q(34) synthetase GluQRS [Silvimonas soli]|uniref:tRNA glutamyl-Q(34) synthetase GluQRS n=1 Tax=Silvimonas soli TaxID=2980100 RepID=UPI0024B32DA8|nr:tRNA glutamyl-Q(34) synthetase GluQRS [Silvimonas soli]